MRHKLCDSISIYGLNEAYEKVMGIPPDQSHMD